MTLKEVRAKLRRRLKSKDAGGFNYEDVFGCEPGMAFVSPHIRVRCELRTVEGDSDHFAFHVFVDFSLPLGADLESAMYFRDVAIDAVRKARSVHRVVDGLMWHRDELMQR